MRRLRTNVSIHIVVARNEAASVDEDDNRPARASRLVCLYWGIDIEAIPCIRAVFDGRLRLDLAVVLALELGLNGPIELCERRRHFGVPGVAKFGQCFPNGLHVDG